MKCYICGDALGKRAVLDLFEVGGERVAVCEHNSPCLERAKENRKNLVLCAAKLFKATLREQLWRKYALDLRGAVGEYLHRARTREEKKRLAALNKIVRLTISIYDFNNSQIQRIRKEKKKNGSVQGKAQGDASRPSRGDRGR